MAQLEARADINQVLIELGFPQNVISAAERARQYIQQNGLNTYELYNKMGYGSNAGAVNTTAAKKRESLLGPLSKTKQQIDAVLGTNTAAMSSAQLNAMADPITKVIVAVIQSGEGSEGAAYQGNSSGTLKNKTQIGKSSNKRGFAGALERTGNAIKGLATGDITHYSTGNYFDYRAKVVDAYNNGSNISVDAGTGLPIPAGDTSLLKEINNWINKYKTQADHLGFDTTKQEAQYKNDDAGLLGDLEKAFQARERIIAQNGRQTTNWMDNTSTAGDIDVTIRKLQTAIYNKAQSNERYLQQFCILLNQSQPKDYAMVKAWMQASGYNIAQIATSANIPKTPMSN